MNKKMSQVLREERDEMGMWVLMGKHSAYGDDQMCQLNLKQTDDGAVKISYADGETHCTGTLDMETKTITGKVQQLLMGEEGFFVPSAEVTHTFRLKLKEETRNARQLRMRLNIARQKRIQALAVLLDVAETEKDLDMTQLKDSDLKSDQLLDDSINLVERVCAILRRQATILQTLTFSSQLHRSDLLSALGNKGLALKAAHQVYESWLVSMSHGSYL
jgi:hypothetical protein